MTSEYRQALDHLRQAQQNFNNADPEYIDAATYQLKAAEELLSVAIKQEKMEGLCKQIY